MSLRKPTFSFSGGEVTPEFWGQVGDAKYQTGLATCRNMVCLPHGPVANRAGTAYVNTVKTPAKKTKLIPFTYSTTQTMVLEFGDQYIRFHTQGATLESSPSVPYEVVSPYLEADLFDLHFVQSADVLTICHPNYAPRELKRLGALSWTLTTINFVSSLAIPSSVSAAATVGTGSTSYSYKITSVGTTGIEESDSSSVVSCTNNLLTTGNYNTISWASTGAARYNIYKQSNGLFGYIGQTDSLSFKDENITANLGKTPPIVNTPFIVNGISSVPITAGGSGYTFFGAACTYDLVVTDTTGFGAKLTATSNTSGAIVSVAVVSPGTGYTAPVVTLPNPLLGGTGATFGTAVLNAGAGTYPGAVSYFEQRRCFAGSTNEPQNLRLTRSGTESNLSYSIPTRDDDSINIRVSAREANTIRHIVPLQNLVLLTGSAEWRVTSVNSDAITPTSISVKPQSFVGANNVQPIIVNNNIIYVAARGGHMREMAYNYQAGGYITGDMSLRAPHLFDGFDVVDLAYAKAPVPTIWAVSSSGELIGCTYVPEQQVGAMHHHDTDGLFESCCVVAEGSEDYLYVVVKRFISGGWTRYVERMASRSFATQSDAFFVDSGSTYSGAPATTISGLSWLEGKTVSVLGDGAVMTPKVVSGGSITLEQPCSKVIVGLPIVADIKTLPLALQLQDSSMGQGHVKNVNRVWLRVHRSSGVFAGPDADNLTQYKQRRTEVYGAPPELTSDEIEIVLTPSWQSGGQVFVRQADPLPLTIVSMTVEVAVGG